MNMWEKLKQELKEEIKKDREMAERVRDERVKFDLTNEAVILSQVLFRMEELEEEESDKGEY